jgi:hypothetical protein
MRRDFKSFGRFSTLEYMYSQTKTLDKRVRERGTQTNPQNDHPLFLSFFFLPILHSHERTDDAEN